MKTQETEKKASALLATGRFYAWDQWKLWLHLRSMRSAFTSLSCTVFLLSQNSVLKIFSQSCKVVVPYMTKYKGCFQAPVLFLWLKRDIWLSHMIVQYLFHRVVFCSRDGTSRLSKGEEAAIFVKCLEQPVNRKRGGYECSLFFGLGET